MATPRIRTRSITQKMVTDLSWLSSRTLLGSPLYGGIQFRLYDGPAFSSKPTRAATASLTDTVVDEIGPPAAGSLSRFFPNKLPYRPLVAFGPRDYSGSAGDKQAGIPASAAAHTFRTWEYTPSSSVSENAAYILDRFTRFHPTSSYKYYGQEERNGVNTVIYFWGNDLESTSDQESIATGMAAQLIAECLPNLKRGGWKKSERMCCMVRPGIDANPEAQARKALSIKEIASLADSRRLAYESMIHQASHTQLAVARGVIEMKDNLPTRKGVAEFLQTATAVRLLLQTGTIPGLKKKFLDDPAALTIGQLASIHLMYQFGIKPTVADVNAFIAQLESLPIATLAASERALLVTGQTVRSAYSIDTGVGERRIDNLCLSEVQTITSTIYTNSTSKNPVLLAMQNFVAKSQLPEGSEWQHRGVLFGRALKPEWTMMPDWFTELYDIAGFEGEPLIRPTKGELALYFNPPLRTLWQTAGYSWLSDWAWNASQALRSLERAAMRIVCSFEELWAVDKWAWTPRRWTCIPVVDQPEISPSDAPEIRGVPSAVEMWYPGVGYRWTPCITLSDVYAVPPPLSVTTRIKYNFVLQAPPTTLWVDTTRAQIPLPQARLPEWFPGKLDAWRISILGAISVLRLQSWSKALKGATWSIAKIATAYKTDKRIDSRKLALAVVGILAAKEFTHE